MNTRSKFALTKFLLALVACLLVACVWPVPAWSDAASPDDLILFLPCAPQGWEEGSVDVDMHDYDGGKWSEVWINYFDPRSGDHVYIDIRDFDYGPGEGRWGEWESSVRQYASAGVGWSAPVAGNPAWMIATEEGAYELIVRVADRFVVTIDALSEPSIHMFADLIDYAGMASPGYEQAPALVAPPGPPVPAPTPFSLVRPEPGIDNENEYIYAGTTLAGVLFLSSFASWMVWSRRRTRARQKEESP